MPKSLLVNCVPFPACDWAMKLLPQLAQLLIIRGITDRRNRRTFLESLNRHLHSPYLMCGMKAAVERIEAAIAREEGILIYGDYDVDGTTAVVILKRPSSFAAALPDFHVPHRIQRRLRSAR